MAGTVDDHNTPRDLDDLFQVLIARDYPAFDARIEIDDALRRGKLRVDEHIKAGARKTSPTPEGHKAAIEGRPADVTYEVSPPGGITRPVNPQSWGGRLFDLIIRDGHLIVEPLYSFDWPWEAISFAIANPIVIDELWPRAVSNPTLTESPPEQVPVESPAKLKKRGATEQAVWEHMNNNPAERDKPGYAKTRWEKQFRREGIKLKTIKNLVAALRNQF